MSLQIRGSTYRIFKPKAELPLSPARTRFNHDKRTHIDENLKLFPIGYPVSEMEVALEYDGFKYYPLIQVLKKLIDACDWEFVMVDGLRLVQRVR